MWCSVVRAGPTPRGRLCARCVEHSARSVLEAPRIEAGSGIISRSAVQSMLKFGPHHGRSRAARRDRAGGSPGPFPRGLLRHSRPPLRSRPLRCLASGLLARRLRDTLLRQRLLRRRRSPLRSWSLCCRACGRFPRRLRDTLLRCLADGSLLRQRLCRRRPSRDGSPGTSRRSRAACGSAGSRVRATEDREGPRSGNKDGLVTRRPLNGDHATPDVGHDAASGRLVHLGAHHLNLVTDFWHESLLTTLVGHIRRPAVLDCGTSMGFRCKVRVSRERFESSWLSGNSTRSRWRNAG